MGMKSEKVAFSIGIIVIAVCILGNVIMAMTNSKDPGDGGGSPEPQQAETERIETETVTETIPYETRIVDDDTVEYGKTVVKTEGVSGEKIYTYKVTYKGKVRLPRELVEEKTIKQPVTKVIANGTKIVWSCEDATSYDRNPNNDNLCTSSTGEQRYVDDCTAVSLDLDYHPSQRGAPRYNGCAR